MIVTRPLNSARTSTAICLATLAVGDLVYISGPKVGLDLTVAKADPYDSAKFPAIAVVIAKITPTRAVVQFEGDVAGVYTGLTPGKIYWLGPTGLPSLTPPAPGLGETYRVQSLGVALDPTILRLDPQKGATIRVP